MIRCDYLIIGGGMTGDAAAKGIREVDPDGSIAVISADRHSPYARPPLSKKLWSGKPLETIWRGTEQLHGVTLRTGRRALRIDRLIKTVIDDTGTTWSYGRLLIATGGTPRRLPFGGDDIVYLRTLDDYFLLRDRLSAGRSFAVIGGGFIGSEIAASLVANGAAVTMVVPEAGICSRIFPPDIVEFLNALYRRNGVTLVTGETVTGCRRDDGDMILVTGSGELRAGCVVAGIGIEPEVSLARDIGLPVSNGIVVDAELCAGDPDIFAAGDVANFHSVMLGQRMRVEHEDNAIAMGRQAGRNMAGAGEDYGHLPYFYSDLFDVGYEAVGELDARLEVFADWKEPYREGVLYYLREGAVRGVLLWNVWDQVDNARALIAEGRNWRPEELRGRLPK
jgi:3-phenylpropionate/trans-cinnamate dioxygenase ferredoxin reductase component